MTEMRMCQVWSITRLALEAYPERLRGQSRLDAISDLVGGKEAEGPPLQSPSGIAKEGKS